MSIFDKFDEKVNLEEVQRQVAAAAANTFEEVPAGQYIAKVEKMELGETKDGRPMFKVQMRLCDAESEAERQYLARFKNKKPCVFMNRVLYGTRNDGAMIAGAVRWLNNMGFNPVVEFRSYSDFEQVVMDCAEQVAGLEMLIDYNPAEFDAISIREVYEG